MQDADPPFLNVRQVAGLLGVHRNTVTAWAAAGAIPVAFRTAGGVPRFRRADIDAFIASRGAA